ncbi:MULTISPECIES: AAA family ATPase [unclassified Polaromonas]|uniref:AAA family ATPase n=1 Tax=unclassified Polaromonas TaxID=2638319 RepID=UPI000F07AC4C|nr:MULTISPECIES: AAA family ATPase [unclassified Polaromonas]AYQ26914.1 hypothetical protein DT070_02005 [Polaromonas sp. SP1]QGJ18238.1 AAA family ATPase [Polaromonas sp. Pch-P]
MIEKLQTNAGGLEPSLRITPPNASANWTTVFIGENGGRKSLVLRLIADSALGRTSYSSNRGGRISIVPVSEGPSRVIAVSGTPLDRFPRSGTTDLKTRKRSAYKQQFVYLGQRAANGMSGVAQSERSLVGSLIANRRLLHEREKLLTDVFGRLGLLPRVLVRLKRAENWSLPHSRAKLLRELKNGIMKILEGLHADGSLSSDDKILERGIETVSSSSGMSRLVRALTSVDESAIRLSISTTRTSVYGASLTVSDCELLLRIGMLEVGSTTFRKSPKNSKQVPETAGGAWLSSGQWSWLGNFAGLCCELRDGSLILIDEPENSLHPDWQLEFVPSLDAILSHFQGCQVVVATHSPLIASGVSPEKGNVRVLRKTTNRRDAVVRSQEVVSTFGWSATDVYEQAFGVRNTRAKNFTKVADQALEVIRNGQKISTDKADALCQKLTEKASQLPPFDALRDVLVQISRDISRLRIKAPK